MTSVGASAVDVVVVAAGSSSRMGGLDKLAVPLLGRPLLAWTLDALRAASCVRQLTVVMAPERVPEVAAQPWIRSVGARVVPGGARRQESVAAGVAATDAPLVLVHDGARPLVSPALVDAVARSAARDGAAIPVLPVAETLKRLAGERVGETVERTGLATAQTPQGARRELLERAWRKFAPWGPREFTDEAALLDAAGIPVTAVPGEPANLKVTVPGDLARAEALLSASAGATRAGHGADEHPFGPGEGLALGGIRIAGAPRLRGHSDGDAVLHAVADALLGATGLGDLGRIFPAGDPATRDIASGELLAQVLGRVLAAGWRPVALDVTIRAARPRLGGARLDAMRDAIASLVGLAPEMVTVKASSGNLIGYEGAGRGIAATAIAMVRRG
jgi:2-C-methyl-D-erythritol 4-phosphate cytidylyltransferase/2-C-methyl-D-erythritol 2,4-cyclodiphosphate synthase